MKVGWTKTWPRVYQGITGWQYGWRGYTITLVGGAVAGRRGCPPAGRSAHCAWPIVADPRSPRCLVAVGYRHDDQSQLHPVFVKSLQGFRIADLPVLEWDLFETTSLELAGGLAVVEEFRCQIANAFRANLTRTSVAIFRSCTDTCSSCACPTSGSDGPKMTIGMPSPAKYRASLDCR